MLLLLAALTLFISFSHSRLVNVTIDDTSGDAHTGQIPQYLPAQPWRAVTPQTENCPMCTTDWSKVHNQTWHEIEISAGDGTSEFGSNVTFSFNGSSIYLFFIVMRAFDTSLAFSLDKTSDPERIHLASNHSASTNDLLYNQLLFRRDGLSDGEHHVVISSLQPPAAEIDDISAALFDYAIYTTTVTDSEVDGPDTQDSASAHSSATNLTNKPAQTRNPISPPSESETRSQAHLGAIVGGAIAGACAVALALGLWFFLRRRRRRNRVVAFEDADFTNPFDRHSHSKRSHWYATSNKSQATATPTGTDSDRSDKMHQLKTALLSPQPGERTPGPSAPASESSAQASESRDLRAELERMRVENEMLRRTVEPPPYSDRHRSATGATL